MRRHSHRRAMTLLELIAMMTLLAAVFGIVAPSLSTFFKGRRLHDEARRFLSLTRYAREQAVSLGETMEIWIDERERTYGLRAQDPYAGVFELPLEYEISDSVEFEFETRGAEFETRDAEDKEIIRYVFRPDGSFEGEELILRDDHQSALAVVPGKTGLGFVLEEREVTER